MKGMDAVYDCVVEAGRWVESAEIADRVGYSLPAVQNRLTGLAKGGKLLRHKAESPGGNGWKWMYVYENGQDVWQLPGAPTFLSPHDLMWEALHEVGCPMTSTEVAEMMGKSKSGARKTLRQLHAKGRVSKAMGIRGQWKVALYEAIESKPEVVSGYHSPLDDWWGDVKVAIERNWGKWCSVL